LLHHQLFLLPHQLIYPFLVLLHQFFVRMTCIRMTCIRMTCIQYKYKTDTSDEWRVHHNS
jgi:hypothetical protein